MSRGRPKEPTGIADAAEWLYSIFDEFKPVDEAASKHINEARVLLDVAVDCAFNAVACNANRAKKKAR